MEMRTPIVDYLLKELRISSNIVINNLRAVGATNRINTISKIEVAFYQFGAFEFLFYAFSWERYIVVWSRNFIGARSTYLNATPTWPKLQRVNMYCLEIINIIAVTVPPRWEWI